MGTFIAFFLFLGIVLASPTRRISRQDSGFQTEPDTIKTCVEWIQAIDGDNCLTLASDGGVDLDDFLAWNPVFDRAGCGAVVVGYSYCISAPPTTPPSSSPTPPPSSPPSTPARAVPPSTNDFPPSGGRLQCVSSSTGNRIPAGEALLNAATEACTSIVNPPGHSPPDQLFLEKGNPYESIQSVGGDGVAFALQIKIGGFTVTRIFCEEQLANVVYGCQQSDGSTQGGCYYTTDFNLESCIFP